MYGQRTFFTGDLKVKEPIKATAADEGDANSSCEGAWSSCDVIDRIVLGTAGKSVLEDLKTLLSKKPL